MRIVILAPPGVQSLDAVRPATKISGRPPGAWATRPHTRSRSWGTRNEPVCGTGSLRFLADGTIHDPDEPIDTLLVGGNPSFEGMDPLVIAWLAPRAPHIRRYGSVCTGVFLFCATAGLLDGPQVTRALGVRRQAFAGTTPT